MRIKNLLGATGAALIFASCATPRNYNYLQDLQNGQQITTPTDGTIRLQPNDMITVLVKSIGIIILLSTAHVAAVTRRSAVPAVVAVAASAVAAVPVAEAAEAAAVWVEEDDDEIEG